MNAIFFVPAPTDPHGLLTPGVCGAMPPFVRRARWASESEGWSEWGDYRFINETAIQESALALAWDGKPLLEGCFRLALRMYCAKNDTHGRDACGEPASGVHWSGGFHQEGVHLKIESAYPGETSLYFLQINSRSSFNRSVMGDLPALAEAPKGPLRLTWMLATAAAAYLGGDVVILSKDTS
jgi:hypothetical protein